MTFDLRGKLLGVVGLMVLVLVSACSGSGDGASGAVGTSGGQAAIGIETSSLFVTITNRTTAPLLNTRVTINPTSPINFVAVLPRLEPGEKRDLSLGNFEGRDGGRLNPASVRPIKIAVTSEDQTGQKFDLTVPWK